MKEISSGKNGSQQDVYERMNSKNNGTNDSSTVIGDKHKQEEHTKYTIQMRVKII
jgi:hypothetical protein